MLLWTLFRAQPTTHTTVFVVAELVLTLNSFHNALAQVGLLSFDEVALLPGLSDEVSNSLLVLVVPCCLRLLWVESVRNMLAISVASELLFFGVQVFKDRLVAIGLAH